MTLDEKVHGLRLHVIQRAAQLGNVSRACREAGISRALFYRWRQRLERYGQDGIHPRRHRELHLVANVHHQHSLPAIELGLQLFRCESPMRIQRS